jgi:prefoldin subunit 5
VVFTSAQPDEFAAARKTMEATLSHLTQSMGELSRAIAEVTHQIHNGHQSQEEEVHRK